MFPRKHSGFKKLRAFAGSGQEALTMDSILFVMFGSVITVCTALTFMEVRRIRKKMDSR